MDRIKDRPLWSPASLDDVSAEVVANFFEPKSPYLTLAPELTIPADLTSGTELNPVKYALPSEEEIGSVVTASGTKSGTHVSKGIQFDELMKTYAKKRGGKLGVKEKIYEVVQRRCKLTDIVGGNRVWLEWKPLPKEGV